jgi:hypothetical protein
MTFDAEASASGFDLTASNESFPFGLVPEVAGPVAQANLNSLPQGSGFASFPYPGDTVVNLPQLAGAIVPGTPQLPAYPFYVKSQLGGEPSDVNQPGLALHAEATPTVAQAKGVTGTEGSGQTATARVATSSDGTVTGTAVADVNLLSLGGLGLFQGVHSTARAVADGSGKVTLTSSLAIARISIPALKLTIPKTTPGSFPLPNPIPGLPQLPQPNLPPIPLPLGGVTLTAPELGFQDGQFSVSLPLLGNRAFAIPAAPVVSALKTLGITLTYQAAQRTPTSIMAAQLTWETIIPAPPTNTYFNGPTDVKVSLGRASASITAAAAPAGGSAPVGSALGSGSSDTGLSSPGDGANATVATSSPDGLGAGSGGPASASTGTAQQPALASSHQVAAGGLGRRTLTRGPLQSNTRNLYLVVVIAGLIGTFGTHALRLWGVRTRWNS